MKVFYREMNDQNIYTIDQRDVLILTKDELPPAQEVDENVCDCTEFRYLQNTMDVNKITPWNLLFNKEVKDFMSKLKKL